MSLGPLVRNKRVLVLCGAGGVGKTTTAAALGVAAARAGRQVLVLTIDPARRLAEAMGMKDHGPEPTAVPPERLGARGAGRLDVWMLEPGIVFERMVRRLAPSEKAARAVLEHRLYRFLSELITGMQEYAAAEALDGFLASERYELIVLDTPPSRHALDFLEAPGRLSRFLDDRIVSLFGPVEGTRGGRLWMGAQALVARVLGPVFGEGFTRELRDFVGAFGSLFAGIRLHTERLRARLSSPDTAFLLVTSPEAAALREAVFFREALAARELPFAGYILNRSWARDEPLPAPEALRPHAQDSAAVQALEALTRLAADEHARATAHRALLARLAEQSPKGAVTVASPDADAGLEDFEGLVRLGDALVPP
ncbi:ArsA family ATPase [Corallococcus sp. H22C18031201]|uniref:ArsA family ATPase n=1 Tax=Citreicoccus inhibens TaxID=2849499 RepID=UPI000E73CD20|nr:ArsA-related P-loop ATPase [Citreicoccus inhibens]MBU8897327.1 AAA family ATPase [Citreicoccus inhibens]RJS21114.1 ArsA family ATPase [Corallococcus sp. H22C18031201]